MFHEIDNQIQNSEENFLHKLIVVHRRHKPMLNSVFQYAGWHLCRTVIVCDTMCFIYYFDSKTRSFRVYRAFGYYCVVLNKSFCRGSNI